MNIYKTVKAIRTSNLTCMFPGLVQTRPLKHFSKRGRGQGNVSDPLIFLALNANSSKTVKATDFKFDMRVSRDIPDMNP